MSYNINIAGHVQDTGDNDPEADEQAIADQARKFVSALEGVQTASASFQHLGGVDLLKES